MVLDVAGESPAARLDIDQGHGVAPLCRRVVWHAEKGQAHWKPGLRLKK